MRMIDLKKTTTTQKNLIKLLKNRDWLDENLKKVQEKYAEKWIAVADQKIQAHGDDPEEVKKNIKGKFSTLEVLTFRVPTGEVSRPV